jgi:hypothetical protein
MAKMPYRATTTELGVGGNSRDNLFWWTVFLISLAGVGIGCWVGSFYIFGHPEKPQPYRILTRLGKLPPPTRFLVTKAPPGEFWGAQRVFEQYSKLTTLQLERENEILFRNYLRNYSENKRPVRYLTGTFTILKAYELQDTDLITSGVVALSQAEEFPQLLVELLYPTPKENVADLLHMLKPGLGVKLEKTLDLSAILHVGLAKDGRLQVTAVPLLYGSYAVRNGTGSFALQPPSSVNVSAGFPLVRGEEVRSVLFEQLEARRKRVVSKEPVRLEPGQGPQLVQMNPQPSLAQSEAGTQANALTAEVVSGTSAVVLTNPGGESMNAGSQPVVAAVPIAKVTTAVSMEAVVASTGSARATSGSAPKVDGAKKTGLAPVAKAGSAVGTAVAEVVAPPKPRVVEGNPVAAAFASAPPPNVLSAPNPGSAGTQSQAASKPSGKPLKEADSRESGAGPSGSKPESVLLARSAGAGVSGPPEMASNRVSARGLEAKAFVAAAPAAIPVAPAGNWKTYGSGQQPGGRVVSTEQATAYADRTDTGRLYLRGQFVVTATGNGRAVLRQARSDDRSPPARVIVEYPAGSVPPAQGSSIARDDGRGFEIREVRKSPDGQVNIYVREISAP